MKPRPTYQPPADVIVKVYIAELYKLYPFLKECSDSVLMMSHVFQKFSEVTQLLDDLSFLSYFSLGCHLAPQLSPTAHTITGMSLMNDYTSRQFLISITS